MSSPYRRPNAWRSNADASLESASAARPPFHPPSSSSSIPNVVNPTTPARQYQPSTSSVASNLYTPAAASVSSASSPNVYSSAIAGGNRFTNVPTPPVNSSFLSSNIGSSYQPSTNLSRIPVEPPLLSGGSGVPLRRLSEEQEPEGGAGGSISARRQAKPPPILTVPDSGAQTPSVRVQVIPPSPPRSTPVVAASPLDPAVQRQEPSIISATGRSTTVDSKEPSLSDDYRRTSLSSNDNSLSEKGPLLINASQTLKPLSTPVPQALSTLPVPQPPQTNPNAPTIFQPSLSPQKPMLPPLTLPTQTAQPTPTPAPVPVPVAAPTMAMPMPMPPMGYNPYPFGMPPAAVGGARPMPPFAPYPPYPIPVSIVSFGPPPPFMVPPTAQNKAVQLPPQQPAIPNRPTTPQPQPAAVKVTPVKPAVSESKSSSPAPSSPSILKLRSLRDSAPTKTEMEMAAERRRNRDCTMLFLWILTALAMVSMAFHLHRYDFDKILYNTFAGAALGLVIIGFILLVAGILLIFVGRSIYERFVSLVLFHSFIALVLSYLLYLPILIKYIPSTRLTSGLVLYQLSTLTDSFNSSASILATLVVHSVTIGIFYFLLIKIFLARGDPDTTSNELSQTEKIELHAALVSVENYEAERASLNDTINKLKRTLNETQEKQLDKQREMDRERRNHQEELKRVSQEKEDLATILDGLDESVANAGDPNKNQKQLYQERLQHLQGTHNMELKKLMNDIEDYRKYNISQEKEIALLREQYLKETARAKSAETELAIIQMQLRDAGLEQSRILALEEQLKNVKAEYERIWALHEKDTADLVLAKQGSCLHCEENKNKYQHLREKHIALEKVNEINLQLQKVIESLKQQLVDAHKRHLTQEQRTKKKVEQIEEDLEAFDQFTQKIDSKQ